MLRVDGEDSSKGTTQMSGTSLEKFKTSCDTAAKCLLVAEFAAFPVFMGLANTLMAFILVLWLLAGGFRRRFESVSASPIFWPALALYALIALGALHSSADTTQIALHLAKYSKLLICLVFMSLLTEERWRRRCAAAFASAMVFILISVYANVIIDLPWSKTQNQGWGQDHTVIGDYITQNIMMSFFALCALMQWRSPSVHRWQRWLGLLIAAAAALAIVQLSYGRTGVVLLGMSLLVFVAHELFRGTTWYKRTIASVAVCAAFFLAITASSSLQQKFIAGVDQIRHYETSTYSSVGSRMLTLKGGIQLLSEHPIIGSGTASYHTLICQTLDARRDCKQHNWHPDNQYIFFAVDHGLVGLGAYAWLLGAAFMLAQRRRYATASPMAVIALGFALIWVVNSLFNSSLFSSRENHFFMYTLALIAAHSLKPRGAQLA
jgi:O-antigen ligase